MDNLKLLYLERLINRLFKIIPMNEEKCPTLDIYIESLVLELLGNTSLFQSDDLFIVSGTLKGITLESVEHKKLKREVFKCIDVVNKYKDKVV